MNINPLVKKAVDIAGSQAELARRCGVKQAHVWKWLRMKEIPAERAIEIETATNGAITRSELRPDLWPSNEAA
jgi:DNA-binding transcriptional regulator YdaS (Cro superfamily)